VGYLKLNQFADTGGAGATGGPAMNSLANADAVIIDLRDNGGGNTVAGYTFDFVSFQLGMRAS